MKVMAGKLNRRVLIQVLQTGQDALGQPITTWVDVDTVWANIKHPSGISEIKSDADISIVKASIRIRYRSDLTAGMRVVYGASTYDIQAILPDAESKVFIDLACELVA